MMKHYFVNMDPKKNPNYNHEVHTPGCQWGDQVPQWRRIALGDFDNEIEAVRAAKRYYSDADGCKECCPRANHD